MDCLLTANYYLFSFLFSIYLSLWKNCINDILYTNAYSVHKHRQCTATSSRRDLKRREIPYLYYWFSNVQIWYYLIEKYFLLLPVILKLLVNNYIMCDFKSFHNSKFKWKKCLNTKEYPIRWYLSGNKIHIKNVCFPFFFRTSVDSIPIFLI